MFGMLIAVAGCLQGMQRGRSAAAVGEAATSAVVLSIVAIVVADGVFAVLCDVLGIDDLMGDDRAARIERARPDHGVRRLRGACATSSFTVRRGSIFIIMGGSGCGKSTLLRHMIGLDEPARGEVLYDGESFTPSVAGRSASACCAASASSTRAARCGAR